MPDASRHLVLVGMMGSGKTTVGTLLAGSLGRPFVDVDEVVETDHGAPVADLFARDGEAAFRRREVEALRRVLTDGEPSVVATGGGVVLDPANHRLMAPHVVVWLRARPETVAARLEGDTSRPLLADDEGGSAPATEVLERLRRLGDERADRYGAVADLVVDVDGLDPADAVEAVRAALAANRRPATPVRRQREVPS